MLGDTDKEEGLVLQRVGNSRRAGTNAGVANLGTAATRFALVVMKTRVPDGAQMNAAVDHQKTIGSPRSKHTSSR
jgi:hypothetical protein